MEAISIVYSECVFVAVVCQHIKRMRRLTLSFVACLAIAYFSTLFHKRHDFREKRLSNIKCVYLFSLQLLSKAFLLIRRTERVAVTNVRKSSCKLSATLVRFQ